MEKLLAGKRAIVTGASGGLGLAIAMNLAADGAQVLAVGRREQALLRTVGRIRELGGIATHCVADLGDPESAEAIVRAALESLGGIEILVNNAGVFVWKPFLDLGRDDFERTLAVNLAAPFHLTQAVARVLVKQGEGGAVVNIASIHGTVGEAQVVAQCASKFGLIGLTKATAEALRDHGIRVNAVCPGAIEADSPQRRSESIRQKVTQADVATLVVFLVSDLAHSITGATVDMPGSTRLQIRV